MKNNNTDDSYCRLLGPKVPKLEVYIMSLDEERKTSHATNNLNYQLGY